MSKSKKQVDEVNQLLKEKLEEMKEIEEKISFTAEDLSQFGMGVIKDSTGDFFLVKLKFDLEKNAAIIESTQNLGKDPAIMQFKGQQYVFDVIYKKAKGDKYV